MEYLLNFIIFTNIFISLICAKDTYIPDASLSVVIKNLILYAVTHLLKFFNIMSQPKIIRHYGYPSETHIVDTKDGYLLEVHRIPHGKNTKQYRNFPVYLQHGIVASSADWIINGPSKALGEYPFKYILTLNFP